MSAEGGEEEKIGAVSKQAQHHKTHVSVVMLRPGAFCFMAESIHIVQTPNHHLCSHREEHSLLLRFK